MGMLIFVLTSPLFYQESSWPRKLLATYYPFGIKKVVEQRKENMKSNFNNIENDDSNIYTQLVQELLKKANVIY